MHKKKLYFVAGIWFLLIGLMVVPNHIQLLFGKTVILETRPVDPRDLLRGDYVILSYEIADYQSIPGGEGLLDQGKEEGVSTVAVYTVLEIGDDDIARPVRMTNEIPQGELFIRGTADVYKAQWSGWGEDDVDYGIGKYFVPEGKGRVLERARNADNLTVEVALSSKGKAIIKQVFLDGKPLDVKDL